jgi:hypothetical protein
MSESAVISSSIVSTFGTSSFLQEMMLENKIKTINATILLRDDIRISESSHK